MTDIQFFKVWLKGAACSLTPYLYAATTHFVCHSSPNCHCLLFLSKWTCIDHIQHIDLTCMLLNVVCVISNWIWDSWRNKTRTDLLSRTFALNQLYGGWLYHLVAKLDCLYWFCTCILKFKALIQNNLEISVGYEIYKLQVSLR